MLQLIDGIYVGTAAPASGGGATINNQDITVTQNGEYTADEGYTGLGTVSVNVLSPYTYNFEKVGNPSVSGCFACNFSGSDYLKSQELTVTGSPQKIHLYTRIYMASVKESYILMLLNSNNNGNGIGTDNPYDNYGYWKWRISESTINGNNYSAGAWYTIHIVQEGGNYVIYVNDTQVKSGTGVIWHTNEAIRVIIGSNSIASATFNTIDLSQTYIAFDDNIIWKAAE